MKIFVLTYNTANVEDAWLQIIPLIKNNHPDIFFIAIQELYHRSYKKYPIHKNGYTRSSVKIAGVKSILLTREEGSHETLKIGLGYFGLPYKGFSMHKFKKNIFINCHLIPHEQNNRKRMLMIDYIFGIISNYKDIDTIVFAGDMNFRVQNTEENKEFIKNNDYDPLRLKEEGIIFNIKYDRFIEGKIEFKPTYKHIVGEDNYDLQRQPSWCDRIFIASRYEIINTEYKSLDINLSDHRPVFSKFEQTKNIIYRDEILNNKNLYHFYKIILAHIFCFLFY